MDLAYLLIIRKEDTAGVRRDLRRVYTAGNPGEAQAARAEFRERRGRVPPEVA